MSFVSTAMRRLSGWGMETHVLFPTIVALLVGVIWASTLSLVHMERANAQRAAIMSTRDLLGTYEAQVVRALRETDQTLRLVKYSYEVHGQRDPLAQLKVRSLLPPDILFTVSMADREGAIVASTRALPVTSVANEDYFKKLRTNDNDILAIGRPSPGETGDRKLQFARRLNAPDGSFAGIVLLSVGAGYFVSGYEVRELGSEGLLGLIGRNGVVLVRRTADAQFSGDDINFSRWVPPSHGEEETPISLRASSWDGIWRYTGGRQLFDFPLAVIVGLSEREQLAAARGKISGYLDRAAIGSLLVVALGGLLWRLSWQLTLSRRREAQAKIEHAQRVEYLAYHDSLTGLPNRSLFSKLLGQAIAQAHRHGKQLAVAFLDLDRFKQVNDTLGHEAGDQLLQEVAHRLKGCIRESDTVARLGGDEFVVLLPGLREASDVTVVAQKILAALATPLMLIGQEFRITASIGISTYPQGGLDEQTLTKNADIAMYHAKETGKNNYQFYSEELNASSLERLTLEASLRHALERDEFLIHYQAKREIATGQITGMEALLRWQHPDLGIVAPSRFLRVAEEIGLSIAIGRWVLETACRQNVAWQKEGLPPMGIAVNITARQFADEHLLEDVAAALQAAGMEPSLLELEIAESLLIRDVERTLRILTKLKAMGVRIAVDGFGTGYSSLTHLQRFPLDTIKIDRSFVSGIEAASPDAHLTDAIISLGRALSLTVVAQGVETREQVDFLRRHACDELQGFYFTKPVPADQVRRLIQSQALEVTLTGLRAVPNLAT